MEQVIWRGVYGYEDRYQVSNTGVIRSLDVVVRCRGNGKRVYKGRVKPTYRNNRGYEMVILCVDNRQATKLVHRLVAEAFVPNPEGKQQVNHKDQDITNNNAENLEWVTDNENKRYSSIESGGTQRPMRPVVVVNLETGSSIIFKGLREAERDLGIDHKSALNVIQGKRKSTKGYWLSYVGGDDFAKTDSFASK